MADQTLANLFLHIANDDDEPLTGYVDGGKVGEGLWQVPMAQSNGSSGFDRGSDVQKRRQKSSSERHLAIYISHTGFLMMTVGIPSICAVVRLNQSISNKVRPQTSVGPNGW